MKKKAVKIEFHQVEGRTSECVKVGFTGPDAWKLVNAHIARCRARMPSNMLGCYKCDFKITYEDGEIYEGRYEMRKEEYLALERHMLNHCEFYAGMSRPFHMTEERYTAFIAKYAPKYKEFLANYEIGGGFKPA